MFRGARVPVESTRSGPCEICGKQSTELRRAVSLGYSGWICPDCELRLRERARRRGLIAGEHTEPSE